MLKVSGLLVMAGKLLRTADIAKTVGKYPDTVCLYEKWGYRLPTTLEGCIVWIEFVRSVSRNRGQLCLDFSGNGHGDSW